MGKGKLFPKSGQNQTKYRDLSRQLPKVKTDASLPYQKKNKNKILELLYPIPTRHNDFSQTFEILKSLDRLKSKIVALTFADKI